MNALEIAAKYTCTSKCGKCPMVVEDFACPKECRIETKAWQCWMTYFREKGMEKKNELLQTDTRLLYEGMEQVIDW